VAVILLIFLRCRPGCIGPEVAERHQASKISAWMPSMTIHPNLSAETIFRCAFNAQCLITAVHFTTLCQVFMQCCTVGLHFIAFW